MSKHKSIGRTKENHPGRLLQSIKVTGDLSPTKRPEVKEKMSKEKLGDKNPMFNKTGELSPSSKLSNDERINIINLFNSGISRKEIAERYKDKITYSTVKRITHGLKNK